MIGNGRFCYQHLEFLPKGFSLYSPVRHCNNSKLSVRIPNKIERSTTDILKALASTLQRDPTSFHYKYPDDPFFYPHSNMAKRQLALSLESGRKSARWIIEKNSGFFQHRLSEPAIKDFIPKQKYNRNSEVTEEVVIDFIKERNVLGAVSLYKILCKKNINLSSETKQLLLELLCYYNCEDKQDEENLELKWFQSANRGTVLKTWKNNNVAEHLSDGMDENCPLRFSALIQGMLKYNEVDKALKLVNSRDKSIKLSVGVYNEILARVNKIVESGIKRWEHIEIILKEMNQEKVHPDLGTLNAILGSIASAGNWDFAEKAAWRTVAEFKKLGICPSLGTYYYLLYISLGRKSGQAFAATKKLAGTVIDHFRERKLEIQHPSDMLFFPWLMSVCSNTFKSCDVAHRLNNLLWESDNVKFLSGNHQESIYYRDYFKLVFRGEPIEYAMEVYRSYVPTIYSPESSVHLDILSAIFLNGAIEFLPEIWKNLKNQKATKNHMILERIFEMVSLYKEDKVPELFHEAATTAWDLLQEENFTPNFVQLTDEFLSDFLVVLGKTERYENALSLLEKARTEKLPGHLTGPSLLVFSQLLMSNNKISEYLDCLSYAAARQYPEAKIMARNVLPRLAGINEDLNWVVDLADEERK